MENLQTLLLIITPLFIGFALPTHAKLVATIDQLLKWLVYGILALIGLSLSQVPDLNQALGSIVSITSVLVVLILGCNLLALVLFDKFHPMQPVSTSVSHHKNNTNNENNKSNNQASSTKTQTSNKTPLAALANPSVLISLLQVFSVVLGFLVGKYVLPLLPQLFAIPPISTHSIDSLITYALMLLILLVGIQLKGSGFTLKQVLLNRRGVQLSVVFTLSSLLAGVLFSWVMPNVSMSKGLALASGFGWYSLSGIIMTDAYGAVWGSVALLNDLAREFFALAFIGLIMPRAPSAAVGVAGVTGMDFTLPIIQRSGGLGIMPLTMSFGFIVNILSPVLMVFFSTVRF